MCEKCFINRKQIFMVLQSATFWMCKQARKISNGFLTTDIRMSRLDLLLNKNNYLGFSGQNI